MNENENTTHQNLLDASKPALKFVAINTYIKKEERLQINNLIFHLRRPEKEVKHTASRRKKIIKVRTEINETENRKAVEKNQ